MKIGKLYLFFITSKVFELQSCASAWIVDRFKSFKKSIYFDDANSRYDPEKKGESILMSKIVSKTSCNKEKALRKLLWYMAA